MYVIPPKITAIHECKKGTIEPHCWWQCRKKTWIEKQNVRPAWQSRSHGDLWANKESSWLHSRRVYQGRTNKTRRINSNCHLCKALSLGSLSPPPLPPVLSPSISLSFCCSSVICPRVGDRSQAQCLRECTQWWYGHTHCTEMFCLSALLLLKEYKQV